MRTKFGIYFFVFLTLVSCKGKKDKGSIISGNIQASEERLEPYIAKFKKYLDDTGQTHDMTYLMVVFDETLSSNILGTCTMGLQYVKINRSLWLRLSADSREQLMFHELGHCILLRYHNENVTNGIPDSIMFPYHFTNYYARADLYSRYISELFSITDDLFAGISFTHGDYAIASTQAPHMTLETQISEGKVFRCHDED